MATYKLKQTDQTDMGDPIYEITVNFKDNTGEQQQVLARVALPNKTKKKSAQQYADELETMAKKGQPNVS